MTEAEKKPIVGQEFLNQAMSRMTKKASGKGNDTPDENKKTDWGKDALDSDAKLRIQQNTRIMAGDEKVEALRLQRDGEIAAEREAAATRVKQLEDADRQRRQDEIDEAKRKAQEEAAERKRLEDEQRAADKADREKKETEMTEKFNQAMQANSPESFLKNYRTWKELQRELNPEEKTSAGTGTDPMIAIELKKLELLQGKEEREFKWRMRQDDKNFQLQLRKMDDDREFRKAELLQSERRDKMITDLPRMIGSSFAKGMIDSEGEGGQPVSGGEGKSFYIEIGEGEAGEVACGNCGAAVGVGPTSTTAVCANCGGRFPIKRIPKPKTGPAPTGLETGPEEEEE